MRRIFAFCLAAAASVACGDDDGGDVRDAGDGGGNDSATRDGGSDGGVVNDADVETDGAREADAGESAFGLDERPVNATCHAWARPSTSRVHVRAQLAFPAIAVDEAVFALMAPSDPASWYVVERRGVVRRFADAPDAADSETVIDVTRDVVAVGEGGLLGMTFHPQYPAEPYAYLYFTASGPRGLESRLVRYETRDGGRTLAAGSGSIVLRVDQPSEYHKGGFVGFGLDGYLYLALGDGSPGSDELHTAQDPDHLLGKILRLDVDGGPPYAVPADNPFAVGGSAPGEGRPEIFALGFRNPWRGGIDRATGVLYVGDVGEDLREEVDKVVLGGNYGWSAKEGTECVREGCENPAFIDPIAEYDHGVGISVIGGYVYRGTRIPELVGAYLYADWISGRVFAAFEQPDGSYRSEELFTAPAGPVSFAEDASGELYLLNMSRGLYRIEPERTGPSDSAVPARLSETGCVEPGDPSRPAAGLVPYAPVATLWSDGADKERFFALPDGETIAVEEDGDFTFPIGSVLMKSFVRGGVRLETRFFVRHDDGSWAGYTYAWNDAQDDATFVPAGARIELGGETWDVPSSAQCLQCHTEAAGHTLGLEVAQLGSSHRYPDGRRAPQLATLAHVGLLDRPLEALPNVPALAALDSDAPVEARARSYLHANCAGCHVPGGPGRGALDLRYATSFHEMGACDAHPVEGTLGLEDARIVAPGAPDRSVLLARLRSLGPERMPPLATESVDEHGTAIVESWIATLVTCTSR